MRILWLYCGTLTRDNSYLFVICTVKLGTLYAQCGFNCGVVLAKAVTKFGQSLGDEGEGKY